MTEVEIDGSVVALVAALSEALQAQEAGDAGGALTTAELCRALGLGRDRVQMALLALKDGGRIEVVKVPRQDLADRVVRVPAYRLRKETGTTGARQRDSK